MISVILAHDMATMLVQHNLIFSEVFHRTSIIRLLSICFLYILLSVLYNRTVALQKMILRWRVFMNEAFEVLEVVEFRVNSHIFVTRFLVMPERRRIVVQYALRQRSLRVSTNNRRLIRHLLLSHQQRR